MKFLQLLYCEADLESKAAYRTDLQLSVITGGSAILCHLHSLNVAPQEKRVSSASSVRDICWESCGHRL